MERSPSQLLWWNTALWNGLLSENNIKIVVKRLKNCFLSRGLALTTLTDVIWDRMWPAWTNRTAHMLPSHSFSLFVLQVAALVHKLLRWRIDCIANVMSYSRLTAMSHRQQKNTQLGTWILYECGPSCCVECVHIQFGTLVSVWIMEITWLSLHELIGH